MKELVYPRERTLGVMTLVIGLIIWLMLIAGTMGIILLLIIIGFIAYLFAQSAFIAHIKGNGVELTPTQFPDLYQQFELCCEKLEIRKRPDVFILQSNEGLNAFATMFLGTQYVVLLADVINAMDEHEDGVSFYVGHELGHLRMNHLGFVHFLRWPSLWLPLLGAAYSRAREYTCDRHGLACCSSPENAAKSLVALSAGAERWKKIQLSSYLDQTKYTSGFWMSFHELCSGYPWLTKRTSRVMNKDATLPKRNFFAYLLAVFVPYSGRLGGGLRLLILIYIIGVLAAIAIPAYTEYTKKVEIDAVVAETNAIRNDLSKYYKANQKVPESLESIGLKSKLVDGTDLILNPENMELTASKKSWQLIFVPSVQEDGKIAWQCVNGEGLKAEQIPSSCNTIF